MPLSMETTLREMLAAENGTTDLNPEMLVQQMAATLEQLVDTVVEQKLTSWFEGIKPELCGMLTDLNVQQLRITQDIVTRLIGEKVDDRLGSLQIPLEGVSKNAVIASCVFNRQVKTLEGRVEPLEGRIDSLATEVSGLVAQYWSFNDNWRKHEMRLLKHEAAYLSHKEWINNCWTAKEKLGDVTQQHDYELKMLKERVTMMEDQKIAARIAALEERIAAMRV